MGSALPFGLALAFPAAVIVNPWAVFPSLPRCWNTGPLLQISKNEASLRIATQHMHPPDVHSQQAYAPAMLL
jgi:hypothetical protein